MYTMSAQEIHDKLTLLMDTPEAQDCDDLSTNWTALRDSYEALRSLIPPGREDSEESELGSTIVSLESDISALRTAIANNTSVNAAVKTDGAVTNRVKRAAEHLPLAGVAGKAKMAPIASLDGKIRKVAVRVMMLKDAGELLKKE